MSTSCTPIRLSLPMAVDKSAQQSAQWLSRAEPGSIGAPRRFASVTKVFGKVEARDWKSKCLDQ